MFRKLLRLFFTLAFLNISSAFATIDAATECLDALIPNYSELERNAFKQVGVEVETLGGGTESRITDDFYRGKVAGALESILSNLRLICELKEDADFKTVTSAASKK